MKMQGDSHLDIDDMRAREVIICCVGVGKSSFVWRFAQEIGCILGVLCAKLLSLPV